MARLWARTPCRADRAPRTYPASRETRAEDGPWPRGAGVMRLSATAWLRSALVRSLESVVCRLSAARCGAWPWGGETKNDTRVLTRLRLQSTLD